MDSSDINRLPKISIVVPVYKEECLVGKLIESIQAQTFCDWELLLIIAVVRTTLQKYVSNMQPPTSA